VRLGTFYCVNITRRLTLLQGLKIVYSQPKKRAWFCLVHLSKVFEKQEMYTIFDWKSDTEVQSGS